MKLLSKRSSSRTSITARSINEGKELSYQMLYNEVQRLADEEANKKAGEESNQSDNKSNEDEVVDAEFEEKK